MYTIIAIALEVFLNSRIHFLYIYLLGSTSNLGNFLNLVGLSSLSLSLSLSLFFGLGGGTIGGGEQSGKIRGISLVRLANKLEVK